MSLLDAARRLLKPGLHEEPNDGAIPYPSYLYCKGEMARGTHGENCPWFRRERIVAVLEAAEAYVQEMEGQGERVDVLKRVKAYQALVAALRGEVAHHEALTTAV